MRCVSDQPWVTAAETCELVMALDAIGETERAKCRSADVVVLNMDVREVRDDPLATPQNGAPFDQARREVESEGDVDALRVFADG